MFERGFEIYESITKEYVTRDIYDEPDGPSKHMLDVREVLNEIKFKFYELEAGTADWEDDVRADFRPVDGYVTLNDGSYMSTGCLGGPKGARK